ncbi:adenylate/guanylate cyclase domain-containing protein [Rhizobium sp. Root1220]|uniref:adenylate/guanylate cyclase domain-containing protein n=1 Tax=Rhizobium sp. Root1220 TaxID=1736432 RepID=UPI0006FB7F4D|nr:adenylate/guanylate cyclase domain-containing protein [Rhizobium sp. Root1220]KQV84526.1 adenylate cyclase [Rhizobium sp. Root1220]
MERRLAAILAADIVGYSRLMGSDESGTLAATKLCRTEILEPRIAQHRGRIVKLTGDGMLVEFSSIVNAVACADEVQRAAAERNQSLLEDKRIEFRIGIHLGDVIVEDGDIFGDGVNVAARLEAIAEPGGIVVSASVRDHVGTRLDLSFEDKGEHRLKNIKEPVRVYAISPRRALPLKVNKAALSAARSEHKQLVAVLPFTNMSGDPEQEYFSDGITEDIITDLSKISRLYVVARNTAFTYKGKSVQVKQVAAELGVDFVLEGSVRKVGQRVRITGQLIDAKNGGHLWADRFDRDLTDIFAIQDEITHAIVDQLKIKLLPEEKRAIETEPTQNVEAYTYYLRGRQLSHTWTRPYLLLARRMFETAVALDPDYARAYAGMADCESALRDWHAGEYTLSGILGLSARALALDPNLAEAHASRGLALHQDGRDAEALAEFERALTLEPDLYEANFHYARFLFMQGKFESALVFFTRAAEIRPDDYLSPIHLMSACRSLGLSDEVENWARVCVERAERALELHPENSGPAHRGALALAHLGDAARAKEWVERAKHIDPDDIVGQYNVACVYALLNECDAALDMLEALLPQSSCYQILWFKHDSDLDSVRNHPRFEKLMDAIEACSASLDFRVASE